MLTYPIGLLGSKTAAIPRNGLVGEWLFSGNANDSSGNGFNGTVNGATLINDRNGNPNSAYSFDGINDYITIGDDPLLRLTNAISMSCWVRRTSTSTGQERFIAKADNYTFYNQSGNYTVFLTGPGGISTPETLNNWIHVCHTYDKDAGTFNNKIYVNGSLANSVTDTAAIGTSTSALVFGAYLGSSLFYSGYLDDVRLYNRQLSDSEVLALYNE